MEQIRLAARSAMELTLRVIELEKQREQADIKVVKEIVSVLKTLSELGLSDDQATHTGVVIMPRVKEDG